MTRALVVFCLIGFACTTSAPPSYGGSYTPTVLYTLQVPSGFNSIVPNDAPYGSTGSAPIVTMGGGYVVGEGFTGVIIDLQQQTHALIWGSTGSAVDLHPAGFDTSNALSTNGTQQVGYGVSTAALADHAILWNGSAASAVDLNPMGFVTSIAVATDGAHQVGYSSGGPGSHALLWNGTAASVVDLTPSGFTSAWATGISGGQQVGYGQSPGTGGSNHALLWTGSAASAVDLNPAGFKSSLVAGTNGSQQVGSGVAATETINEDHALLWNGSAATAVDLSPAGSTNSVAISTNGTLQVGVVDSQAELWSGTAASAVDLGGLLPSHTNSAAYAIDSTGNVFGIARNSQTGIYEAVEWSITPEPNSSLLVLSCLALFALVRRRPAL